MFSSLSIFSNGHILVDSPCRQEEAITKKNGERKEMEEKERRNEEEDVESEREEEEGDENAEPMTLWYRLHPFFTNLI